MPQPACTFDSASLDRIAREIDHAGFAAIPDFVDADAIARARAVAAAAVDGRHGEYAVFTGPAELGGTVLADLPASPDFQALCAGLYQRAAGRPARTDGFYQVFRCLKGSTGRAHSAHFHFDSYLVTALLPVALPATGPAGDLIVFPNRRRVRRSYARHFVDKLAFENPLAQRLARFGAARRRFGAVPIRLRPGTLYLFWGYRSLHANEACDPDQLRATALFHYGNPHGESRVRGGLRDLRRLSVGLARSRTAAQTAS